MSQRPAQLICPRDGTPLIVEKRRGIEIDRCSECKGMWYDFHELGELEGKIIADEEARGTLVYSPRPSPLSCPVCSTTLTEFQYHGRRLELDMCPNGHGYWLDKGEDDQVLEFMDERLRALRRARSAERNWRQQRRGRSLSDKIRNLFGGR